MKNWRVDKYGIAFELELRGYTIGCEIDADGDFTFDDLQTYIPISELIAMVDAYKKEIEE